MEEYKSFSDEQLVELNKYGDTLAFDQLYSRYIVAIKSLARTYYLVGGDEEDLSQEGLIGLFSAVNAYNTRRESCSSFKTYAFRCIKSRMINAILGATCDKHKALNNSVSLIDIIEAEKEGIISSPEDKAIGEENLAELITKIRGVLSPFEIQVFDMYVDGAKYTEIATKLHKEPKSVDNAIQRIKEKTKRLR